MLNTLRELRVSDGRVTEILVRQGKVLVRFMDWQENEHILEFEDVVGLAETGAFGVDLSHVAEDSNDPMISSACEIVEENTIEFSCFLFYSVLHDSPVIKIVARRFREGGETGTQLRGPLGVRPSVAGQK